MLGQIKGHIHIKHYYFSSVENIGFIERSPRPFIRRVWFWGSVGFYLKQSLLHGHINVSGKL